MAMIQRKVRYLCAFVATSVALAGCGAESATGEPGGTEDAQADVAGGTDDVGVDATNDTTAQPDVPTADLVAADVPPDVAQDAAPDAAQDAAPDVASDVAPDTAPDVGVDVAPDIAADTWDVPTPDDAVAPDDAAVTDTGLPGCPNDAACDDDNVCTDDVCAKGKCVHTDAQAACNDNDPCTTDDVCTGGTCAGLKPTCDDKIACTLDLCDIAGACSHLPNDAACADANPCTTDTCDVAIGCTNVDAPKGTTCTDGDACTGVDDCAGSTCMSGTPVNCNDGDPCTTDACDSSTGACSHPFAAPGTACDDGVACTTADVCDGSGGCKGVNGCPEPLCNATPRAILDYPDAIGAVSVVTVMDNRVIFGVRDPGGNKLGKVVSCPKKEGCGVANANMKTLVDLFAPHVLVPHGTRLRMADAGNFGSGAKDGYMIDCDGLGCNVDVVQLAFNQISITDAIVVGTQAVWYSSSVLTYADLQTGQSTFVPLTEANLGLTTDGAAIFTSSQYTPKAIEKIQNGQVTTLLGDTGGGAHRYAPTYAGGYVYWVTSMGLDAGVWRISAAGGLPELLHVAAQGSPRNLLVEGAKSYYAQSPYGVIAVWDNDAQTEKVLVDGLGQLDSWPYNRVLAVDDQCLYFGTYGGAVYTVAK